MDRAQVWVRLLVTQFLIVFWFCPPADAEARFGRNGELLFAAGSADGGSGGWTADRLNDGGGFDGDARVDDGSMELVAPPSLIIDDGGWIRVAFPGSRSTWTALDQQFYTHKPVAEQSWPWRNVGVKPQPDPVNLDCSLASLGDDVALGWMRSGLGEWPNPRFARTHGKEGFGDVVPVLKGQLPDRQRWYAVVRVVDGVVLMMWTEGYAPELSAPFIAASGDSGATWHRRPDPFRDHPLGDAAISPPNLEIGPLGELNLLYYEASERLSVWCSLDHGGSWDGPRYIGEASSSIGKTSVAVSSAGTIGVVWSDVLTDNTTDLLFRLSSDGGASWTEPVIVNEGWPAGNYYFPVLAVDAGGTWHIVCIWNMPWEYPVNLFYTSSSGGRRWADPVRVNDEFGAVVASGPRTVSMDVENQGFAHVSWIQGTCDWCRDKVLYATNRTSSVNVPTDTSRSSSFSCTVVTPCRDRLVVRPHGYSQREATISLVDVGGRLVRTWSAFLQGEGSALSWDLRDDDGRPVPNGVYLLYVSGARASWSQSIVVLR